MYKADLVRILGAESVLENESMARHTSFRTGGNARFYVTPETPTQMAALLRFCRENGIKHMVIGNASNLLIPDEGFDGVFIATTAMNRIMLLPRNRILADAGASLASIAQKALKNNLTGMEKLSGIPGTVGGGVFMNAGAYLGEIKDVFDYALIITQGGELKAVYSEYMDFGYRHSAIETNHDIVLQVCVKLEAGEYSAIRNAMNYYNGQRVEKQPLDMPSAGSTFKRPNIPDKYAGKLIESAGLKGYQIGGAMVSTKHAGFIVNAGGATTADILALMEHIRQRVLETSGILLEAEVKLLCC